MKTLTTKKRIVERFYNENEQQAKQLKDGRLARITDSDKFDGKQSSLLDEIVFKTVNNGVYHCNASSLKSKCGVGHTTLAAFNRNLKESKQFIVARYRTATCNFRGLVYVDVLHANFYDNMRELFEMNELDTDRYLAQISTQKRASEVIVSTKEQQKEVMNDYSTNEFQRELFEHIHAMNYSEEIKQFSYKIALKVDNSRQAFNAAIKSIVSIAADLRARKLVLNKPSDVVRVFAGSLRKALDYRVPAPAPAITNAKPAPLYDWLTHR